MYKEVFTSICYPTKEDAERKLAAVRELHNSEHGWKEISARIEKTPDGWRAIREHVKTS